jgi:hypothetical protein
VSRRTFFALLGIVLVCLWGRALLTGFWLDETVTAWVVQDGAATAIARAREYQSGSLLYLLIAWASRALLGPSELALRAPSLVFGGVALLLLVRLGARVLDVESARLAALFLACAIYREASNARPYALAICAVVAAVLAAVRWAERPTWVTTVVLAAASALVAWVHVLFVLAWPAILVLALRGRINRSKLAVGLALVLALVVPLVPQVLALGERRAQLSFAAVPTIAALLADLVRPPAIVVFALGVALAFVARDRDRPRVAAFQRPRLLLPLLTWCLVPPLVLFVIARTSEAQLYVARYHASALPGVALIFAWATRLLEPARIRLFVSIVLVMLALVGLTVMPPSPSQYEDWRAALSTVRAVRPSEETLVLVRPGLVESDDPAWINDPGRRDYLLAPLAYYPVPGSVRLLPRRLTKATEPVFEALVSEAARAPRTIVVARASAPEREWLDQRLRNVGLASHVLAIGALAVIEYRVREPATR